MFHKRMMRQVFLLLYGLVVVVVSQNNDQNTSALCCQQTEEDGLESADIAAIILGVILFLMLLIAILICILVKKGCIGGKEQDVSKVMPVAMGFSTTADKLRGQTRAAVETEKEQRKKRPHKDEKQPIIYIFDDIYHPPNSRPLPQNRTIPNGYPSATREVRTPRKPMPEKAKRIQKIPNRPKSEPKTPRDHGDGTSQSSSRTVSVKGHLIFPDNGRINFTTSYQASEPYRF